jgi:acyl transferase domain-containing protein/acyl carrier protein
MSENPEQRYKQLLARALTRISELEEQTKPDPLLGEQEPIAVVGAACRFPGGAHDLASYWRLLHEGKDAIREVGNERWPLEAADGMRCWAGLIDDVDQFDSEYFGISPREAQGMDPQHRLLLTLTWEALAHAGVAVSSLRGLPVGVFVGIMNTDYIHRLMTRDAARAQDVYVVTGNGHSFAAGRIAYHLGVRGPALAVDTACSSSLVSIQLAMEALRRGECELAIAAGVSLITSPDAMLMMAKTGAYAPEGRCRPFDARANGYVRGEGCGAIVLKRASAARRDRDAVLCLIRAACVNHDGHSSGLTVPCGEAQVELLKRVQTVAGVSADSVGYIEAHGTGTALGDPIEFDAIKDSYGEGAANRCAIGSVKGNIGHLEGAAGIAGFIKAMLCVQQGVIPPLAHLEEQNPLLDVAGSRFFFPKQACEWPIAVGPRRAALSSFGLSGTNAHLILEQAEARAPMQMPDRGCEVMLLSARDAQSVAELASRMGPALAGQSLRAVGSALSLGREQQRDRAAIVAADTQQALDALGALAAGEPHPAVRSGRARAHQRITFVFSGHGSQWPQMTRALCEREPVFAKAWTAALAAIKAHVAWSPEHMLAQVQTDPSVFERVEVVQPLLFAYQVAAAAQLVHWGLLPDAVIGASMGEVAAAHASGRLSLHDAALVICKRSELAAQTRGAMLVVNASDPIVRPHLSSLEGQVGLAAINAPDSTVVSGDHECLRTLAATFERENIQVRWIKVGFGGHSPQVASQADRLVTELTALQPSVGLVPMYSTVVARQLRDDEPLDARYWARNLCQTVEFQAAVEQAAARGDGCFIELSPHPVLLPALHSIFSQAKSAATAFATGLRDDEARGMCDALANAYVAGLPVAWERVFPGPRARLPLPQPSWQNQSFWAPWRMQRARAGGHELAGSRVDLASGALVFEGVWSLERLPQLRDHCVRATVVVPSSVFLVTLLQLGERLLGARCEVRDATLAEPLQLPADGECIVQTLLERRGEDALWFQLSSKPAQGELPWLRHMDGTLQVQSTAAAPVAWSAHEALTELNVADAYEALHDSGLQLGPSFRRMRQLSHDEHAAYASVEGLTEAETDQPLAASLVLDAALQTLTFARGLPRHRDPFLAVGLDRVQIFGSLRGALAVRASLREQSISERGLVGDVVVKSERGEVVAVLEGFVARRMAQTSLTQDSMEGLFTVPSWRPQPLPVGPRRALEGRWLVMADTGGVAHGICSFLSAAGADCVRIYAAEQSQQIEPNVFELDVRQPRALLGVLDSLGVEDEPVRGIIHLWGLDGARDAQPARLDTVLLGATRALQAAAWVSDQAPPEVWFVTAGAHAVTDGEDVDPTATALWSLVRSARAELQDLVLASIDLDMGTRRDGISAVCAELSVGMSPLETQIAYRNQQRYGARLRPLNLPESVRTLAGEHVLQQHVAGDLDSLCWRRSPQPRPSAGEILVHVTHSALNRRQVEHAAGVTLDAGPDALAVECVGTVAELGAGVSGLVVGQRVALLTRQHAARVVAAAFEAVPVPDEVSSEAAVTLPIAFAIATRVLRELAPVGPQHAVLIHGAAGAVGMAAVQVARAAGARVFASASFGKFQSLRALGVQEALDSRTDRFVSEVLAQTNGRGVDVVVHTIGPELLGASARAVAPGGRLVLIGSAPAQCDDVEALLPEGARLLRFDASLFGSRQVTASIAEALAAVARGSLSALPVQSFCADDVREAFRHLLRCQHVGKVVLAHDALRSQIAPDATYLVTGGLSGLGLHTAQILADAGARHLMLCSRRGQTEEAEPVLAALRARGIDVRTAALDVGDAPSVEMLLTQVRSSMPRLAGVFHSAAEFADAMLANLDPAILSRALHAKARGAWNLHLATRDDALEHFVLYSSIAASFGSQGLPAYAAANGFLDGLAAHRRAHGLPALSIAWGLWSGVGVGAQQDEAWNQRRAAAGFGLLDPERGREGLLRALEGALPQLGIADIRWPALLRTLGHAGVPRFLEAWAHLNATPAAAADAHSNALAGLILAAAPGAEVSTCCEQLRCFAARITGRDSDGIDPTAELTDLGMDSLMTVELRTMIVQSTSINLAPSVLYSHPTLEKLAAYLVDRVLIARIQETKTTAVGEVEELTI